MNRFLISTLCALPSLATQIQAAELDPIIASDTRSSAVSSTIPASIQVIDRTDIEVSGATNIGELLAGRSGIFVSDPFGDGSTANIDMRGFGNNANNNILITVNGRRLNPSSDSATLYLNSIDLDNVERIEVIQGSAAILYGNMAVGGMINIVTREPGERAISAQADAGSYDAVGARLNAGERAADGWGYQLNARARNTDNYRDRNAARLRTLSVMLDKQNRDARSFVEFVYFDEYQQTPGALFADELAADRRQAPYDSDFIDTVSHQLRVGHHTQLNAAWRFEGEIGYRIDDREFIQSYRSLPGTLATQDRDIWTVNPRLIGKLGDNTFTLGADTEITNYTLRSSVGPQRVDQAIYAIYGQWSHAFDQRATITAGVRHARVFNDIYNDSFGAISTGDFNDRFTVGSLGATFRITEHWRAFARAEQNFRFAKVDEHTNTGFGNPIGLKNPHGVSYEIGTEFAHHGIRLSATAYRLDLKDEIAYNASLYKNENLEQTRRYGLQLSYSQPIGVSIRSGLSLDLTEGELSSGPYEGKRIPNVPRHQLRMFAEWAINTRTAAYVEALNVGDRVLGGDHANSYPAIKSYTVVNLRVGYRVDRWQLAARINNLLDRSYIATGALGFDASFVERPGYNPAAERNFNLSAQYTF